MRYGN